MPAKPSRKAVKSVPRKARARNTALSVVAKVEKAAEIFRGGGVIAVSVRGGSVLALAVETARDKTIADLGAHKDLRLVLTHARARTLKIRLYTPDVVALALDKDARADNLRAIADPTSDLAAPMKGPFVAERSALSTAVAAGVKLAKLAGLLPAILVRPVAKIPRGVFELEASDIENYASESVRTLELITRARVPLEGAENAELAAFRPKDGGPEHYAVIINAPPTGKPVLTRLHSECFTGDLLGSLRCDCGAQLRGAIEAIATNGAGILLYLAQEGRGVGLINKLRAYRLQDQGFDTIEANGRLGFEADERLYAVAARMLALLGYKSVRLLTNNPDKVKALQSAGVNVVARVPHKFPDNIHNRAYLRTKAEKAGHLF
jgi:GTP cyclohydrolase II